MSSLTPLWYKGSFPQAIFRFISWAFLLARLSFHLPHLSSVNSSVSCSRVATPRLSQSWTPLLLDKTRRPPSNSFRMPWCGGPCWPLYDVVFKSREGWSVFLLHDDHAKLLTPYKLSFSIQANLPYILWIVAFNTSFILAFYLLDMIFFPTRISKLKDPSDPSGKRILQEDPTTSTPKSAPVLLEAINKNGLVIFLLVSPDPGQISSV